VLINVAELSYQLKKAYAASGGSSNSSNSSDSSYDSAVAVANSSNGSSARRRQLGAAPSVGGDAHMTYYVSVRASDSAPYISLHLPTSPYFSPHLPTSPYISTHLPTSPHISPYLLIGARLRLGARLLQADRERHPLAPGQRRLRAR